MEDYYFRELALFAGLSRGTAGELAAMCKVSTFSRGQTILRQGEPGGYFYVICSGKAEVVFSGQGVSTVLAVLGPGDYFGEMSLLTGEPTSAAVVAAEECRTLLIPKEGFARLLEELPALSNRLVNTLSQRLRRVNEGVWEARGREQALARLLNENRTGHYGELIGKSKCLREARESVKRWARQDSPLHISGEPGTGRELLARAVHAAGPGKDGPFISVDCAVLDGEGLEEKFFGRFGFLELACGGTLLLKNVELLEPCLLEKLADYTDGLSHGVRLITAGREGAASRMAAFLKPGTHSWLFGESFHLVPLRERKKDIPDLVSYILERLAAVHGRPAPCVDTQALEMLLSYDFCRGNVAELEEVLERAFLLADGGTICPDHIFLGGVPPKSGPSFNLLRAGKIKELIDRKTVLKTFRAAVCAFFLALIFTCMSWPKGIPGMLANSLAWSLGWPAFVFSCALFGRLTCTLCPISSVSLAVQSFYSLSRPVPQFIKKYDYLIITFLFAFIIWVEEVTGMREAPRATGILFLAILGGAVWASVTYQRQTWCRHICPLGGFFGVCAMASPVELRSNPEVCLNKCTSHECYKGTEKAPGCPLFQHPPFVDNSQSCKMCLNCAVNCPNGSVQLNLRLPAAEIPAMSRFNRGMAVMVAVLLAMVVPLVAFDRLHSLLGRGEWLAWFSAAYWAAVLAAGGAVLLFLRGRMTGDGPLAQLRLIFAAVPLAVGVQAAYQAGFLPLAGKYILVLGLAGYGTGTAGAALLSCGLTDVMRALFLICGLAVSLLCVRRAASDPGLKKAGALASAVTLAVLTAIFWVLFFKFGPNFYRLYSLIN